MGFHCMELSMCRFRFSSKNMLVDGLVMLNYSLSVNECVNVCVRRTGISSNVCSHLIPRISLRSKMNLTEIKRLLKMK